MIQFKSADRCPKFTRERGAISIKAKSKSLSVKRLECKETMCKVCGDYKTNSLVRIETKDLKTGGIHVNQFPICQRCCCFYWQYSDGKHWLHDYKGEGFYTNWPPSYKSEFLGISFTQKTRHNPGRCEARNYKIRCYEGKAEFDLEIEAPGLLLSFCMCRRHVERYFELAKEYFEDPDFIPELKVSKERL